MKMSVVFKSMRLDGCDKYEEKGEIYSYTGKELASGGLGCCMDPDDIKFNINLLEDLCKGIGCEDQSYLGCCFCTEFYDRNLEGDPYLRWRAVNRAPDLCLEYFGEEGVNIWLSDASFASKHYNIYVTYDEFLQVVKEEFEPLTKGNSPQAEEVSRLLQCLEVNLEEAKNSKVGFSMTRQEGLEIIRREGLQRHNVDGVQEYRPGDTVIKQEDDLWCVYYLNEKGQRNAEYNHFIREEDAWAFFIAILREEEKGRCGPPLTRQEAEEIIRRENLRNNRMGEDGSILEEQAVVIRKEGELWKVYNTDEKVRNADDMWRRYTQDRNFSREEDAWASYVERLWIEASRHRLIRKGLGLEET